MRYSYVKTSIKVTISFIITLYHLVPMRYLYLKTSIKVTDTSQIGFLHFQKKNHRNMIFLDFFSGKILNWGIFWKQL